MNLSPQQESAIRSIDQWRKHSPRQDFFLGGFAGTGKTTLLKYLIEALKSTPFFACAPTGKAASVLMGKLGGEIPVSTVHSALYAPSPPSIEALIQLEAKLVNHPGNEALMASIREEKLRLSKLKLRFNMREEPRIKPNDLVIIEECSMVTKKMREDLAATGAKLLYVGDPGQLPPVNDEGFYTKNKPDAMLTEVHRQALDSPIVRLSMMIREGRTPDNFSEPFCRRIPKSEVDHDTWLRASVILTGKNETRRRINNFFRKKLGYSKSMWPLVGEKLICLKNCNSQGLRLINGVEAISTADAIVSEATDELYISYLYEGSPTPAEAAWKYPFEVHQNPGAVEDPWSSRTGLVEFDFGYAITVHKSQGSEWDFVLLADDEMMANKPDFRQRWLYTAVTRAKKELLWIT